MPDQPGNVWHELERLRDWRHNEAVPALASMRGRVQSLERRMDKIEPNVDRVARTSEIADAVAERMHERRTELFTPLQKGVAVLVGLAALADFIRGLIMGH